MVNIPASASATRRIDTNITASQSEAVKKTLSDKAPLTAGTKATGQVSNDVSISTLAGRLSAAEASTNASIQNMDHKTLPDKVKGNIQQILYVLNDDNLASAAAQVPEPNDAEAKTSADAATSFVQNKGANPFGGLSREQLSTIANDESGTFTINERRAAYMESYNQEEAWREQAVAKAKQEYNDTGKLTEFFKQSLAHFMELPKLEQALYPENYASDLQDKIKLDFNYFNHSAGDGGPTPSSLATLNKNSGATAASSQISSLLQFPGQPRQ